MPPGETLCLTCKLGGLIRCPELGVPLPLVQDEKPKVVYRGSLLDWSWTDSSGKPIRGWPK